MADEIEDCEFWLPPQFLTDDDFVIQSKNEGGLRDFRKQFSFGSNSTSELSSPGESVVCSTETESDEDEYITGLTQRMAHSTLEDNTHRNKQSKAWDFSGSPKSPLCKQGLNRYSPRFHTQVASRDGLKQGEGAWDLLCAAAEEVAKMKMLEESAAFYSNRNGNGVISRPPKVNPVPLQQPEILGSNVGFRTPNQPQVSYQQLQAATFEHLRRQQMMKKQEEAANGVWGQAKGGCGHLYQVNLSQQMAQRNGVRRPAGLPISSWPTLQQSQQQQQPQPLPLPQPQPGSGMRAVFLGNPGGKRECAGTGVFLPRRIGSPTETRKNKPGCSTVLVPDRVVQALNLKLDIVDPQPQPQPQHNATITPDYDAFLKYRKNLVMAQQRQSSLRQPPPPPPAQPVMHQEVHHRLPLEWTY